MLVAVGQCSSSACSGMACLQQWQVHFICVPHYVFKACAGTLATVGDVLIAQIAYLRAVSSKQSCHIHCHVVVSFKCNISFMLLYASCQYSEQLLHQVTPLLPKTAQKVWGSELDTVCQRQTLLQQPQGHNSSDNTHE